MPLPVAAPVRSAGRQRDERTDAALIDAVLDLVNSGATLSGISFVAIAEHAGVSRNSLYRRWKTKDALYLDVLASLNRPLPDLPGVNVRDDVAALLSVIIERSIDPRKGQMLRALNAEASKFPLLYRRYFDEVVAPRRAVLLDLLQRGVDRGDIAADVDLDLAASVLVAPILSRVASNMTEGLDPATTSREITDIVFAGVGAAEAERRGPPWQDGDMTSERMEVQRTIAADPATIFRVLSDPQGHVTIDSSGMLMDATGDPVKAVGDTFVVHMDREALNDFPMGLYDVTVIITTFDPDREIAWTIEGQIKPPIGHIYGYTLEPVRRRHPRHLLLRLVEHRPAWKEAASSRSSPRARCAPRSASSPAPCSEAPERDYCDSIAARTCASASLFDTPRRHAVAAKAAAASTICRFRSRLVSRGGVSLTKLPCRPAARAHLGARAPGRSARPCPARHRDRRRVA